jgi:hypothetical protein
MRSLLPFWLCITWGCCQLLNAGDSTISGPFLGFVFDPQASGLRPIVGTPGASLMGDPLDPGTRIGRAEISPRQDYALVSIGDEIRVLRFGDRSLRTLPDAAADRIAISPSGRAAVLYRRETNSFQVFASLPDSIATARMTRLMDRGAGLTAIAVSDDGLALLAAFSDGVSGGVFVVGAEGDARLIQPARRASAIAFLANGHDALIADASEDKLWLVRDVAGSSNALLIAGERDGVAGPVAVASSADNQRALVANSRSSTVAVFDLSGGAPAVVSCPCVPALLDRLTGNAVFRLTEPSAGPMWLFDGDSAELRTVFVPPSPVNVAVPRPVRRIGHEKNR